MKNLLSITFLMLLSISAFSKDKKAAATGYFRAGFAYSIAQAGSLYLLHEDYLIRASGTQTFDGTYMTANNKKASFSSGLSATVAAGLMFNEHIGLDLGLNIGLVMKKYELAFRSTDPANTYGINFTSYAKMPMVIMPSLLMSTGNKPIAIYTRIGLAVPLAARVVTEAVYSNSLSTNFELKNGVSIGFQGALGMKFKLGNSVGLFTEFNGMSLNLHPKTGKYTAIIADGQNVTTRFNVSDREYTYSSQYVESPNPGIPSPAIDHGTPFSNIGIALGISINL